MLTHETRTKLYNIAHAAHVRSYYQAYPEKAAQARTVRHSQRLEESKNWRKQNVDKVKEYNKQYYANDIEGQRARVKVYNEAVTPHRATLRGRRIRAEVLNHYGVVCQCCGEDRWEFLCMDHMNNDGAEHRKKVPAVRLYTWLIETGFPEGYQVLCHNCNMAKGIYGYCPHTREA